MLDANLLEPSGPDRGRPDCGQELQAGIHLVAATLHQLQKPLTPDLAADAGTQSAYCAVQAYAIAAMGAASHRWPVGLTEFEAIHREEIEAAIQGGSDRSFNGSETCINSGSAEAKVEELGLPTWKQ